MPDWVSEEEFDIQQAFAWSPQGTHIAYLQWDESTVPEYTIQKYSTTYPELFTYKYPKAGEEPAQVRAKIYSVQTQKTSTIQFPGTYTYIPEFSWIDSTHIAFTLLNRLQNKVEIAVYSLLDNSCKIVYTYTSKTYVDIPTYFTHIEGTNSFIICNDSDGYNNLYIYTYESGFAKKITQNLGDITDVYGYFKESNTIMFQATNNNPLERYVFELNLQTGVLHCLSDEPGTHTLDVNSLGTGWIREYSNKNPMVTVYIEGKNLEQNREPFANYWMQDVAKNMKFSTVEFFTIPTQDNEKLNAYIMKPHKFRKTKQYPVVVMVYGGPGMQKVTNEWTYDFYWNQYLTQHGYIVVAVDCRGTDGRGSNFRKQTYLNLGEKESFDFAATAQYLRTLPYVDKQNITIQGWSYGAYMALLTAAKYPDSYNSVIAIAPVTKWELYDNIYTERYMQTPTLNPEGYKNSSVFTYIQNIKAPILLAHGTADDNVHIQNTYELISELIKNEKDFETLIFPNDEHSLFGKNSRMYLYSKYIDFLETHSKSNK
jgi:dipeptidyl-peptidase-4